MSDADYSDSSEAQDIKRRKIEKKIEIVPSSSGSDEELIIVEPSPKPRKKKNSGKRYEQKYVKSWEMEDTFKGWLSKKHGSEVAICLWCNAELSYKKGKTDLTAHARTSVHVKNTVTPKAMPPAISVYMVHDEFPSVLETEAKIASFLVSNNLPFSLSDQLIPLLKAMPPKSVLDKVRLGKQKVVNVVRQGLGPYYKQKVVEEMKVRPFSLVIDETTDVGTVKQLAVCVSFCNNEMETDIDVIDFVECSNGSAVSIFTKLEETLEFLRVSEVPLRNWVGFCRDTTNAMMGCNNSVATLIQRSYPWVLIVKCSCHSIHLWALYACKKLTKTLEDLCRHVYNHFNMSAKRTAALKEFQLFSETAVHKILAPGQTRWLSLQNCVHRILEQWNALTLYFTSAHFEDPTHGSELVLSALKNPFMRIVMMFVDYALGLLNDFNTVFQSKAPIFYRLKIEVIQLVETLLKNFMNARAVRSCTDIMKIDVEDEASYVDLRKVYLALDAEAAMTGLLASSDGRNTNPNEVDKVYSTAREFSKEVVIQIKSRFSFE